VLLVLVFVKIINMSLHLAYSQTAKTAINIIFYCSPTDNTAISGC